MLWNDSELLVQQLKEVAYSFERLRIAIADIDHAIAFALQRLRSRLAKPTREKRRRNTLWADGHTRRMIYDQLRRAMFLCHKPGGS